LYYLIVDEIGSICLAKSGCIEYNSKRKIVKYFKLKIVLGSVSSQYKKSSKMHRIQFQKEAIPKQEMGRDFFFLVFFSSWSGTSFYTSIYQYIFSIITLKFQ